MAYTEEEEYWKEKSRDSWMLSGDRNTKFFHALVKAARGKKRIEKLLDVNGLVQKSEASTGEVVVAYFQELFKSSSPASFDEFFQVFQAKEIRNE